MTDIKIGDFVKVIRPDTSNYCLYVTDILFKEVGIIFKQKFLQEITGIIVESSIKFNLFKKRRLFLKNSLKIIKKVTDKKKIGKLLIQHKIYLLQKN